MLRDLPRSSPLSDWKFFVRGLAAHYRGNSEESQANWDRLDANRKACRIANRLRDSASFTHTNSTDADGTALEKEVFGEPVLARLAALRSLLANQEWDKVIRLLVSLRHSLRRLDRNLAERLTRILIGPLFLEARELDLEDAEQLINSFTRSAEPLAIDPRWNRFWAVASDVMEVDNDTTRDYWMNYIHDLETIPAFSPAERPLAQAMVWNRVAALYRDETEELESPGSMMAMFASLLSEPANPAELERSRNKP